MSPGRSLPPMPDIPFTLLTAVGLCLLVPPAALHIHNGNVAATSLIFWIGLANLVYLLDSTIWAGNDHRSFWDGRIYCDIVVKLMCGMLVGTLGSITAILQHLASIMSLQRGALQSQAERRRRTATELVWSFGAPVLMSSLHYVVQPQRYWIVGVAGCTLRADNSWLSFLVLFIWPPVFALVACCFAALVLVRYHRHRATFASIIADHQGGKIRFIRLLFLSVTQIVVYLPLTLYLFAVNIAGEILPYSWAAVHNPDAWATIVILPASRVPLDYWIAPVSAILIFVFFGTGSEAVSMYRRAAARIRACCSRLRHPGHHHQSLYYDDDDDGKTLRISYTSEKGHPSPVFSHNTILAASTTKP